MEGHDHQTTGEDFKDSLSRLLLLQQQRPKKKYTDHCHRNQTNKRIFQDNHQSVNSVRLFVEKDDS